MKTFGLGLGLGAAACQTVSVATDTFTDTFTDTAGTLLTAHTADTGETWAFGFGSLQTSPAQIADNGVWAPTGTREYRASWSPSSADYYVEAIVQLYSAITDNLGVCGRFQADAQTFYLAIWSTASGGWRLLKCLAGVFTQIGSTFADTFTTGSRTVRLAMVGTTITVSIDGTVRITETNADIAGVGSAGLRFASAAQAAATGRHFMSVTAAVI